MSTFRIYESLHAYLCAVVVMASTISMMRCRAESVPMVISVPQKSLSIDPTMPTILRCEELLASFAVILPEDTIKMLLKEKNCTT